MGIELSEGPNASEIKFFRCSNGLSNVSKNHTS